MPEDSIPRALPGDPGAYAHGQKDEADQHGFEADVVAGVERRELIEDGAEPFQPQLAFLDNVHQARAEGYEEGRVGQKYQARVDGEEQFLERIVYPFRLSGIPRGDRGDGREAEDQGKDESLECIR